MVEEIKIENMIYEIRGKQVMLDSDIAKLYGCKNGTKEVNQAVRNNLDKFPERFSWKLTDIEVKELLVKIFDQKNIELRGGKYKNPRVFTEQGVAMLATILKSKTAIEVSIRIMDAFVAMRNFINENKDLFKRLTIAEYKLLEHDSKIDELFDKFEPKKLKKEKIFFKGEVYDAYSLIIDLIKEANERIIIIDNYIDTSILDLLTHKKEDIYTMIVTSSHYIGLDKFNTQYKLNIKYTNLFHDRFIIIDDNLYHVGASLKDLGNKCFGINKIEDKDYLDCILKNI